MQLEKTENYLADTTELAKNIQSAFWELGKRLCKIKGEELWRGAHASYDDFLEELQITRSMDTKLRTVYLRFKDAVSPVKIAEIGISKLYLIASRCPDSPQTLEIASRAHEMTRADLMDGIREKTHGEHECKGDEVCFLICSVCGRWNKLLDN